MVSGSEVDCTRGEEAGAVSSVVAAVAVIAVAAGVAVVDDTASSSESRII